MTSVQSPPVLKGKNYWKSMVSRIVIEHQAEDPDVISKGKEFRLREHDNLFWKMETHMIMHDLAYEFFWQRAFLLNLSILLLGVAISIIGVLQSGKGVAIPSTNITGLVSDVGDALEDAGDAIQDAYQDTFGSPVEAPIDDFDEDLFDDMGNSTGRFLQETATETVQQRIQATQFIAILGILITFLKSFEKYFNYQSRADLHESAVITLKDITDELFTTRHDVDLLCDEEYDCDSPKKRRRPDASKKLTEEEQRELEKIEEDVEEEFENYRNQSKLCKAKFDTMQKACTDPIPPPLHDHFAELEEVLKFASYDLKYYFFRRYYHKLSARLRESKTHCTPPFCLDCFQTEDIYEELYGDISYFFEQTAVNATKKEVEEEAEKKKDPNLMSDTGALMV